MFTRRMLWVESAVSDESEGGQRAINRKIVHAPEREEYDNLEGDIGVADGDNVL